VRVPTTLGSNEEGPVGDTAPGKGGDAPGSPQEFDAPMLGGMTQRAEQDG